VQIVTYLMKASMQPSLPETKPLYTLFKHFQSLHGLLDMLITSTAYILEVLTKKLLFLAS
jgi:hypothetical protein